MIRPFTFVTAMMMLGSGAWMFVVKHRAEQLDHRIGGVTAQIRSAEQRIRVLRAEWALETDPSRLQRLAALFLPGLQPMKPDQMVTMQELAARLPAPGAAVPYLPLPPPLPDQLPDEPATVMPAVPAGPVAVAAPPKALPLPPPARPVMQVAAHDNTAQASHRRPVTQQFADAHRHKPVPVPPQQMREATRAPKRLGASVLAPRAVSKPMGARVMAITATAAGMPPPAASASAQGTASRRSSVFGDFGASLPPPQPIRGSAP